MEYHVVHRQPNLSTHYNWGIDEKLLRRMVKAYLKGETELTISGVKYKIGSIVFKIYESKPIEGVGGVIAESLVKHQLQNSIDKEAYFEKSFKDVTGFFLRGMNWGELKDALFNVYLNTGDRKSVKLAIQKEDLVKFIVSWENGESIGWLGGSIFQLKDLRTFQVFDIDVEYREQTVGETKKLLKNEKIKYSGEWSISVLEVFGKEVSNDFNIGPYGSKKQAESSKASRILPNKLKGKIFISHSSKDKSIVNEFTNEILILCLGAENSKIFCTSIEGLGITSGENFRTRIKKELEEAQIVIQIISKDYKASEVCLNEMGAAWVLADRVIPLIIDGQYDVGFLHNTTHQLNLTKKKDILQFIDDLEDLFPNKAKSAKIDGHVEKFLKVINEKY